MILEARADKFEAALTSIDSRLSGFEKSVAGVTAKAQSAFEAVGSTIGTAFAALGAIGAAAGLGGLTAVTKSALDSASAINDLSVRLGINSDALQELQFAAKLSGVSLEELSGGLQKFEKNISEAAQGTGAAKDSLKEMGLDAKQLASIFAADPVRALQLFSDHLKDFGTQADKIRVVTDLMGKGAGGLVPVFQQGGAALAEFAQRAHDTSNVLGQELVKSADTLGDRFDAALGGIKNQFNESFLLMAPLVVRSLEAINDGLRGLKDILADTTPEAIALKAALAGIAAPALVTGISSLVTAVVSLGAAIVAIGATLLTNPFGIMVLGIGLGTAAVTALILKLREISASLSHFGADLQGVADASQVTWHQLTEGAELSFAATVKLGGNMTSLATQTKAATDATNGLTDAMRKAREQMDADIEATTRHVAILKEAVKNNNTLKQAQDLVRQSDLQAKTGDVERTAELTKQQLAEEKLTKALTDRDKSVADSISKQKQEAEALARHTKEIQGQIDVLAKQQAAFQQFTSGQITFGQAEEKAAAAANVLKAGATGLGQKLADQARDTDKAKEAMKRLNETLVEADDNIKSFNKSLNQEIASFQDQTKAQQTYLDTLKQAIADGADFETAQHKAALAMEDLTFWMGEFRKARAQGFDATAATELANKVAAVRQETEAATQATKDFETQAQASYLHLGDIIQQGIQGLAQGTLDISNFLAQQGQAAITAFATSFLLGKKGQLDIPFAANITGLVGPGGLIGDLFGTGGGIAGFNFATSMSSTLQNTIKANQVVWQTAGQTGGQSFLSSFGDTILGGIDQLFGTSLQSSIGSGSGVFTALGIAGAEAFIAGFIADLVGASGEAKLGAELGTFILGPLGGILGGFLGGLFAHTPTAGTTIRKGTKAWLEDIKVSFSDQIDSGNYFFEETKKLANKMFGGDFLAASKQILVEKNGPELAKQLQALGTFITSGQAKELGKSVEQAGVTFGNMLSDGLLVSDLPAAIQEIVEKGKITLIDLTTRLTQLFKSKDISPEFYKDSILGAVSIFSKDLPEAIHVSSIALKSFKDDGTFDLEAFQTATQKAVSEFDAASAAFRDALLNSKDGEEAAKRFGEGLHNGLLQIAQDAFITDFVKNTLFQGIDFSDGISQAEIDTMKERVGQAKVAFDALGKAFDDTTDKAKDTGTALADTGTKAQELTDKIIALNAQLQDLAQKRIDIRVTFTQDLVHIGALGALPALQAQYGAAEARLGPLLASGGFSPIATRTPGLGNGPNQDLSGLSDQALQDAYDTLGTLRTLTLQEYDFYHNAIEQNRQSWIKSITDNEAAQEKAINAGLTAQIKAINDAEKETEKAIHAEFEAKRTAIQGAIDGLNVEKTKIQEANQARLDQLNKELDIAKQWQQVANSLQDQLRGLITSNSPYQATEQLALLQLQAEDVRRQMAAATPAQQPALAQDLAKVLGQELQVAKGLPGFDAFFKSVVSELEALQQSAAGKGSKAEDLQQQIATANEDMKTALKSIDAQIKAQEQLLSDLSTQESDAITAAQQQAADDITAAQDQAARDITAAQHQMALDINAANALADAAQETLMDDTNKRLKDIFDLQDSVLREQEKRAMKARQDAVDQLNSIEHSEAYLAEVSLNTANAVANLQGINAGIAILSQTIGGSTGLAGGTNGIIQVNRPKLYRVGESGPESMWVGPQGTMPGGSGVSVSVAVSPTFAVTMQGSQDPEGDGRRFVRGAQQELIYMVQHEELGQQIVRKVREARGM